MTFFALFVACYFLPLHIILSKASFYFNTFCIDWSSNSGHFHALYLALSCGVKDYNSTFFAFFKQLGLVHLLVVSGAHLAFIEKWLTSSFKVGGALPGFAAQALAAQKQGDSFLSAVAALMWGQLLRFWPLVVLVLYVLLSGAQPPVVRALFFVFFCGLNRVHQLNYSPFLCSVASGVGVVLLFPHWLGGWSLVMSVLASLLIHLPSRVGPFYLGSSFLAVCTRMYVGLMPVLLVFGLPHPLSILVNWAFTPVFTVLLFPMSLLAYAVPVFSFVADGVWQGTYVVLQNLGVPETLPPAALFHPAYIALLWSYAVGLAALGWIQATSGATTSGVVLDRHKSNK